MKYLSSFWVRKQLCFFQRQASSPCLTTEPNTQCEGSNSKFFSTSTLVCSVQICPMLLNFAQFCSALLNLDKVCSTLRSYAQILCLFFKRDPKWPPITPYYKIKGCLQKKKLEIKILTFGPMADIFGMKKYFWNFCLKSWL